MTMKTSDLIVYPSRCETADVLAGLRRVLGSVPDHAEEFLSELEAYCLEHGLDFAVIASHGANECNYYRDNRFKVRRDAFGIGVTESGVPGAAFDSYEDAAFFAVFEYRVKLGRSVLNADWDRARAIYPAKVARLTMLTSRPDWPKVTTIDGLNTTFGDNDCFWMCDENGPAAIVAKGNALVNVPDQQSGGTDPMPSEITFGLVPLPDIDVRDIPSNINTAWSNNGPRTVRGIVWHRSIGSHLGNDSYFRGEGSDRALTDYGIGVAAQDGAGLAGSIYRWNDPQGTRSPWANGPLSAPYGDGLAFFNKYGVTGVNRDLTSVEISGFQTTPLDEKSRQAIAELTAYWGDQAHIPWTEFPMVHGEARSFVLWHTELTRGTGKLCPFDVVMAETAALIERTRAILKKYQSGSDAPPPKPPTYAAPDVPEWMADDLEKGVPTDHVYKDVPVYACLRQYEAVKSAKRRRFASMDSEIVGPPLKVREKFTGWYWSKSADGKRTWVWTPFGTRVEASALTPRVSIRKA